MTTDTKIILAVIGSMLAGLLIATVLPPRPSRDAIDAGGPAPENATALADAAPENPTALADAAPENPTGLAGPAPESPTSSASRRPGRRASSPGPPPGPATQLARQRNWVSRSPSRESLTVTGVVADAWRDGRIFVQVYEDPEETGVLVMAGFDPQTWEEPLGELDLGTRMRLHGVNAVARSVAVRMDGTEFERLAAASAAPEGDAPPPGPAPGPATQLARQRGRLTTFQAATHPGVRADNLTTTGVVWSVWRRDGRIYVSVYEDPEETGALVITGFDPQGWEENDLARGTRVRLHGVNAVAGRIAVKMDGTQLERLVEAAPE